ENFEELEELESMALAEVERIFSLSKSVEMTMQDSEACKLLRRFMESEKKSMQCLDIYEKCAEYLAEKHPNYDSLELDILARLGLAPHLKQQLVYRLNNGDPISISLCLKNIMRACQYEVEEFFTDFKNSITKKLKTLKLDPVE
ncbi:hypothetical protein KR084_003867, partial [Drosophila pseudotakahashii]